MWRRTCFVDCAGLELLRCSIRLRSVNCAFLETSDVQFLACSTITNINHLRIGMVLAIILALSGGVLIDAFRVPQSRIRTIRGPQDRSRIHIGWILLIDQARLFPLCSRLFMLRQGEVGGMHIIRNCSCLVAFNPYSPAFHGLVWALDKVDGSVNLARGRKVGGPVRLSSSLVRQTFRGPLWLKF